jgi:predicted DNA-binding protein with PD1-like motif
VSARAGGAPARLRTLVQPGRPAARRIESVDGPALEAAFVVPAGATLLEGIAAGMARAGLRSGAVRLADVEVAALQYVRPAPAPDGGHVAFYSQTHRIDRPVRLQQVVATFGEADGRPFVHAHGLWFDERGRLQGGHLHNDAVRAAADAPARAWGLAGASLDLEFDEETRFSLLRPRRLADAADAPAGRRRCVIAKVRPNEDLVGGIERVAAAHGIAAARIVGSVGSLVGASFADGREVADDATEILVLHGAVASPGGVPRATLEIALIDPRGDVHVGAPAAGGNAVLICAELVLVEDGRPA